MAFPRVNTVFLVTSPPWDEIMENEFEYNRGGHGGHLSY